MHITDETALKKVKVDRAKLITKLKENLKQHRKDYTVAMEGYRQEQQRLMGELSAATAVCYEKPVSETRAAVAKAYRAYSTLDVPADHAKDYEKAITVMEWMESDKVKLSMNDFQCYVEDDWNWKRTFRTTVANYANR